MRAVTCLLPTPSLSTPCPLGTGSVLFPAAFSFHTQLRKKAICPPHSLFFHPLRFSGLSTGKPISDASVDAPEINQSLQGFSVQTQFIRSRQPALLGRSLVRRRLIRIPLCSFAGGRLSPQRGGAAIRTPQKQSNSLRRKPFVMLL